MTTPGSEHAHLSRKYVRPFKFCQFSGKIIYATRGDAWDSAERVTACNARRRRSHYRGRRAWVYECKQCGGWHLTSAERRR